MSTKYSNQIQTRTAFSLPSANPSEKTFVLFSETEPAVKFTGIILLTEKLQLLLHIICTGLAFKAQLRNKHHDMVKLTKLKLVLWNKTGYIPTNLGKSVSEYLQLSEKFKNLDLEQARNKYFSLENVNPKFIEKSIQFMELIKQGVKGYEIARMFDLTAARVNQILHLNPEYDEHLRKKSLARQEALRGKKFPISNKTILNADKLEDYWDWDKNKIGPAEAMKGEVEDIFLKCPKCTFTWYQPAQPDLKDEENFVTTDKCPACVFKPRKKYKKSQPLMEVYPDLVNAYWDTEKNSAIGADPARIAINSSLFAFFKCSKHGNEWEKRVNNIVNSYWAKGKSGCWECYREKIEQKLLQFKGKQTEGSASLSR